VNELQASENSLLASQLRVSARVRKYREASTIARMGGFPIKNEKENHPGCVGFGSFAKFY